MRCSNGALRNLHKTYNLEICFLIAQNPWDRRRARYDDSNRARKKYHYMDKVPYKVLVVELLAWPSSDRGQMEVET